jgi:hypothetical protein
MWNAVAAQSGARVTATNAAWNRRIAPGQSVVLGFLGTTWGANPAPELLTVDGSVCSALSGE